MDSSDLSKTHIINNNTANVQPVKSVTTGLLDINTGFTKPIDESIADTTINTRDLCKWCYSSPIVPSFVSKELCISCSVTKNVLNMMDSMRGLKYE
jgi:hypothetical protein